jgi:hypothetical protein
MGGRAAARQAPGRAPAHDRDTSAALSERVALSTSRRGQRLPHPVLRSVSKAAGPPPITYLTTARRKGLGAFWRTRRCPSRNRASMRLFRAQYFAECSAGGCVDSLAVPLCGSGAVDQRGDWKAPCLKPTRMRTPTSGVVKGMHFACPLPPSVADVGYADRRVRRHARRSNSASANDPRGCG